MWFHSGFIISARGFDNCMDNSILNPIFFSMQFKSEYYFPERVIVFAFKYSTKFNMVYKIFVSVKDYHDRLNTCILTHLCLKTPELLWWNVFDHEVLGKIFEGEMSIRTLSTTPLQIFCEFDQNFSGTFKSARNPEEICQGDVQASMG